MNPTFKHRVRVGKTIETIQRCWSVTYFLIWATPPLIVLALIGFYIFLSGGSVADSAIWPNQHVLFLSWNGALAQIPSDVWSIVTLLGDAAVILALLSWLLFSKPHFWAAMLASVPAGAMISVSAKQWASASRPAAVLDSTTFNVIGPLLQYNSFQSGHSISAFAVFVAVLVTYYSARPRQRWRDIAIILGSLLTSVAVAVSRVAVGAHWPLDIAAGAAFGWLAGLSGAALALRVDWWSWLFYGSARYVISICLILWGLLLWLRPHETLSCGAIVGLAGLNAILTGVFLLSRNSVLNHEQN